MRGCLFLPALALAPLLWACQPSSPSNLPTAREEQPRLAAPPGALEEDAGGSFEQRLARAQTLEKERRTGEALREYRRALELASASTAASDKQQAEQAISRLSFVLGVQDGGGDSSGSAKPTPAPVTAVPASPARAQYEQARALEQSGKSAEARVLYQQLQRSLSEKEDGELYWLVWQRLSDLTPEAETPLPPPIRRGPAPVSPTGKQTEEDDEQEGSLPTDGSVIPQTGRSRAAEEQDERLSRARVLYISAGSAARARDINQARESYQEVLRLVSETQDAELVRNAKRELEKLEKKGGL